MPSNIVQGFSTPAVSRLSGVPMSTLHYWARQGVVTPTLRASVGRRATRWWSLQDLVAARAVKALRESGCPLQTLARAHSVITDAWLERPEDSVLYWDGVDVLALSSLGDVTSVLRHPGQRVLHIVAIPVHQWGIEAANDPDYVDVDIDRLKHRDAERMKRRRTQFATSSG